MPSTRATAFCPKNPQDIIGQRIAKVIETLNHIDRRLSDLTSFADAGLGSAGAVSAGHAENDLVSGPSLEGAGVDQDQVDALLA